MTTHCMVDIETLGVECVVQIGATKFNEESEEELASFSINIDPRVGNGPMDADTVVWWLGQSEDARSAVFFGSAVGLNRALKEFARWYKEDPEPSLLWCHATYDAVVLDDAYKFQKMRTPWHFREVRDLRTLFGLAPIATHVAYEKHKPGFLKHDGLSDARLQTAVWRDVVKALQEDGVRDIG